MNKKNRDQKGTDL